MAAYGMPGTHEVCSGLEGLVPEHNAILLENHGVVTSGQDLATAYYRMETVEQCTWIWLAAETLGDPNLLLRLQVQKLMAARSRRAVPSSAEVTNLP